jgi:hypothetical protein
MRTLVAVVALGSLLVAATPRPAQAGAAVDAALALGAFAVFNQLFVLPWLARPAYAAPVVYSSPPAVYAPAAVPSRPAAPLVEREVVHPHGRYVLRGDGVTVAYRWIWVPNPPAGPPPPPPR